MLPSLAQQRLLKACNIPAFCIIGACAWHVLHLNLHHVHKMHMALSAGNGSGMRICAGARPASAVWTAGL